MWKKIIRSSLLWASLCVILQVLVAVIFSSQNATFVASLVLIIAAFFILKLEKYKNEMPLNRYALAFAVVAIILMIANLWAYTNIADKFSLI